jgi:hypothetical protein
MCSYQQQQQQQQSVDSKNTTDIKQVSGHVSSKLNEKRFPLVLNLKWHMAKRRKSA